MPNIHVKRILLACSLVDSLVDVWYSRGCKLLSANKKRKSITPITPKATITIVAVFAIAGATAIATVDAVVAVVAAVAAFAKVAIMAVVAVDTVGAVVAINAIDAPPALPTTRISLVHFLPVWVLFSKFRANAIDRFIFSVLEFFVSFEYFSFHF